MAIIGKIRKRVGLVIGFIGLSLILFILGDLVTSNKGIMSRNSDVIGIVGGEKVRYPEFEKKVEQMQENYKLNQQKDNIDQSTSDMLREQAWSTTLTELILGKEYQHLDITCGPEELYDMCTGKNVHEQIKQAFTDRKTGVFNPQDVVRFLKDLPNRDEATQKQWKTFEEAIQQERIANKYKDLIKGGLFVTSAEAKQNYLDNGRMASFKYIRLGYESIADSSVVVEDSDLHDYYNKHQNDYKQAETIRKVEYVAFDIMTSAEDRNAALEWITKKKDEFASATDAFALAAQYSDEAIDTMYKAKGSLPAALDTVLFSASTGTLIGPYVDGGNYKMAKLVNSKMVADSVKARHILIKIQNNDTLSAKNKIDSLKNLLSKGGKFDDLAKRFSEDGGSAVKGGDLGWFPPHKMVAPFNDACFNGNKGDKPIVLSQFGYHLIEVMDKGKPSPQIQVAIIEHKVEPSQKTYDAVYTIAQQFATTNNTAELFDSACVKQGLSKRIADNLKESDKTVAGLEQPREMVRWAYKSKVGEISKVFTFGDKYVVAHLTGTKEKGILPLDDVKDRVKSGAIKEKKATMLVEQMHSKAEAVKSIDDAGQKLNTGVLSSDNNTFGNTYIQNVGNEPRIVGIIFALKPGQISKPIKGENGVFMIKLEKITEPAEVKDFTANQKQLLDARKQRSDYEVFNALKEKANVEDFRGKFY